MWPDDQQTRAWLARAEQQDRDAVDALMEGHRDAVRHLVRLRLDRKIQGRVDVSDVVQDVLIEAHRRLAGYLANPVMPFHLWLRQIAKDRVIDAHRRHRSSARRSVDREVPQSVPRGFDQSSMQLIAQLGDPRLTPAAVALQREMARRIEQAIGELDERDREIIVMRHYEYLSNQEIAQVLNLTEPAASMRYLRAVRRLREQLQELSSQDRPPCPSDS